MSNCLYRARSVIADFHGLDLAEIFWIPLRAERLRFGPPNLLIADYGDFSATEISLAKGYIDEFLTLPEANGLKHSLLKQQGYNLELVEYSIPLNCRDVSGRVIEPLRVLPDSTWRGSALIPHRGKMELPFDVLALWRDAQSTIAKEDKI